MKVAWLPRGSFWALPAGISAATRRPSADIAPHHAASRSGNILAMNGTGREHDVGSDLRAEGLLTAEVDVESDDGGFAGGPHRRARTRP
jgi:hypothetical protein